MIVVAQKTLLQSAMSRPDCSTLWKKLFHTVKKYSTGGEIFWVWNIFIFVPV